MDALILRPFESAAELFTHPVTQKLGIDPDLIRVAEAWPTLPFPIRAAVLAMIDSHQRIAAKAA